MVLISAPRSGQWLSPLGEDILWRDILRTFIENYSEHADTLFPALIEHGLYGVRTYQNGAALCERGDRADCLWLIVSGEVDVCDENGNLILVRRAGELVGEQAFLLEQTPIRRALAGGGGAAGCAGGAISAGVGALGSGTFNGGELVLRSVVGGAVAKLTGGKFEIGALTAAMSYLATTLGNNAQQGNVARGVVGNDNGASTWVGNIEGFSSRDEAANFALDVWNDLSIGQNREYGGIIYSTRIEDSEIFGFTIVKGGQGSLNPDLGFKMGDNVTRHASWHTHGNYSNFTGKVSSAEVDYRSGIKSDLFSPDDLEYGRRRQERMYLGTPSGRYKWYDPTLKSGEQFGILK